jgi:hypothetical protein
MIASMGDSLFKAVIAAAVSEDRRRQDVSTACNLAISYLQRFQLCALWEFLHIAAADDIYL